MQLWQVEKGYRYNSDTLFLHHFISTLNIHGRVLDVGCGCGILGLLLKRDFSHIDLTQIDIQQICFEIAQRNSVINNLKSNIVHGDFLDFIPHKPFDMIVSNPPFYHDDVKKSEDPSLLASRYASMLPLDKFIKHCNRLLTSTGTLYMCYDAKQIDEIFSIMQKHKLKITNIRFVHPKEEKEASIILIRAKKSSKSLCKIHTPLYMYKGVHYSKEAKNIFINANTTSCSCAIS